MRIAVFGSTGHTGRHVVADGARRGHEIVAFTRRPERLSDVQGAAAVVTGDGRDPEAVDAAIAGADAVIAIVSAGSRKGPHHTADVMRVITGAMSRADVRRLVITTPYPIVAERPRVPIALLRLVFAAAYADQAEAERVVSGSDLDWTIARLNRLTDEPAHGSVHVSRDLLDRPSALPRADAAATLLDLVEDDGYARTAVNLSGR